MTVGRKVTAPSAVDAPEKEPTVCLLPGSIDERTFVLGNEVRVRILTSGVETDGRHDLTESVMPPDTATPLHMHTRHEERLWVLEGSITVWAGRDQTRMDVGHFYSTRANVPHAVRSGPEGARLLNITSPAAYAELIAKAGTPAHLATPDTQIDADQLLAVSAEMGDVILGPPGTIPSDLTPAATPPSAA